jgi:DNA replication protein DnaC
LASFGFGDLGAYRTGIITALYNRDITNPNLRLYDTIGEKTISDAILDRLIHQSHRLELHEESMRKKRGINKE